jgi:hypothetical protein
MISPKELYSSAPYRALDDRRKKLVSAILIYGQTFSAAARVAKLNQSREQKNPKVLNCLKAFGHEISGGAGLFGEPGTSEDGNLNVYEQARRLSWLVGDRSQDPPAELEEIPWNLSAEDRAFWSNLGLEITQLPARPDTAPAEVIAAWNAWCKAKSVADDASKRAQHLARHPNCDGCSNALDPANAVIRGINVVCPACADLWNRTGTCPKPNEPARACAVDVQPPPPSEPQTSRCSRCGRTTPQGVGLCSDCSTGVNW